MFEVCYLNDSGFDENLNREICSFLKDEADRYDLIIINDFGHGFISPAMQEVLAHSKATLAVNAQTNSANYGFNLISKYQRADYVCIDEPELRLATHDKKGDLKDLIRQVYDRMKCRTVAITRGHKGSMVYSAKGFAEAPVLSTKIVDTVGAGDAFFALTAPLEHVGCSPLEIGFIGNAVGALAVQIVCNREPINYQQLTKFITAMLK
jgi:sugar/nucleoside kinase (ribokinase family)